MKKIIMILGMCLALYGCGNSTKTVIKDGDNAIIVKDGKTLFNKADLTEKMLYKISTEEILSNVINKIYDLEKLNTVDKEVEATINTYKTQLGANFEKQIQAAGLGNIDNFKKVVATKIKKEKLAESYVDINAEQLLKEYKPVKIQYAAFKSEEMANKALEELKNNNDFSKVAKNNQSTVNPQVMIITEKSTITTEVKDYILKNSSTKGLSEVVKLTTTPGNDSSKKNDGYFIFNIIENDINNFKDEALKNIASSIEKGSIYSHYFTKHGFNVYNQELYEAINNLYPGAL